MTLHLSEQEAHVLGLENRRGAPLAKYVVAKRRRKQSEKSKGEETLALHLKLEGMPDPEREYKFHPERCWRFDFAYPAIKLAIEVDGGVYKSGRHTRGKGWEEDAIKLAEAVILGWTVLRFSTGQVKSGIAIDMIKRLIEGRKEKTV